MNMKKTMAAVAASAMAISAIAVPANAAVENAVTTGTSFTYSLVKTYEVLQDGTANIVAQFNANPATDRIVIDLTGTAAGAPVTISATATDGDARFTPFTFTRGGDDDGAAKDTYAVKDGIIISGDTLTIEPGAFYGKSVDARFTVTGLANEGGSRSGNTSGHSFKTSRDLVDYATKVGVIGALNTGKAWLTVAVTREYGAAAAPTIDDAAIAAARDAGQQAAKDDILALELSQGTALADLLSSADASAEAQALDWANATVKVTSGSATSLISNIGDGVETSNNGTAWALATSSSTKADGFNLTVVGSVSTSSAAYVDDLAAYTAGYNYLQPLFYKEFADDIVEAAIGTNSSYAAMIIERGQAAVAALGADTGSGEIVKLETPEAITGSALGYALSFNNFVASGTTTQRQPYKSFSNYQNAGPVNIIDWLSTSQTAPKNTAWQWTSDPDRDGKYDAGTAEGTYATAQLVNADGVNHGTAKIATSKDNYVNVAAVINDCIANYPNVTFTFNTATDPVVTEASQQKAIYGPVALIGFYGWNDTVGDALYKNAFKQYIYGNFGSDPSTFVPFDPGAYFTNGIGYNLFTGALIINDAYTMQLADTEMFSYNATSLVFDYQALKDNAYASYNNSLNMIYSMKLATSVPWYWDSMTISFAAAADDTADSDAGTTSDEEILPDEPADAPAEEVETLPAETEAPATEAPVAPAANPGTGNAPVALAVIPVALAAAAIIAKKRK
jgi:hypothetical protein